jgi:predicted transcriptional regulator
MKGETLMPVKLFDSELKVMEVVWKEGEPTAKEVAKILGESIGWNKNTTYTVIKKCVDKGAIARIEPNFVCRPLVSREEVQSSELDELVDKLFDGSREMLFASLVGREKISGEMVEKLIAIVEKAGKS